MTLATTAKRSAGTAVTMELLDAMTAAWNSNNTDAIMAYFANDAVFDHGAGPDVYGKRFRGKNELRAVFQGLFDKVESVNWKTVDARVSGDKAYCEYHRVAKLKTGQIEEFLTVDILTFRDGLIVHKDTYFKNRKA